MKARKKINLIIRQLVLFLFLLGSISVSASENSQRDTVYLRNGEIVIGEIKELRIGMLSFDSKDVGLISLKISKIKTINSSSDTLRIETANKEIYFGALKPSEKAGWVYIVTASHRHLIEIGNINSLLSFHKNFWNDLSGNISSGFSYSHSSGIGQLNFSLSVVYTAKRFGLSMTGSGIASIDTSTFSRDREDLNITGLYNVKNMWYAVLMFEYQRNLQLSISRRFQQLGAAGYKFVFSQNFQTLGIAGLGISQERSTTGVDENFLLEMPMGFSLDFYKFSKPNMQISSQHIFYVGFTQWGRVRYDANTTLNWELFKDFSFSLTLYLDYDSQPPDPTAGKMDYGTVVGLTYKF
ncbi:MAG: DUF481 domain-containing protein [Tannerella sp.]|jgi:hypothetical protein|nr:DUF481 domain-containing protein [Tannerella sp.]